MNLLLVNSAAPELWGGGEKWFVEGSLWFAARGHNVTLICRPHSKLLLRATERGVHCESCTFGGDFDPFALAHAVGVLRRVRPDIVLTNFNKESWQFGLAGALLRVPVAARHGFTVWSRKRHHRFLAERILRHVIVNAESIRTHYAELGISPRGVSVIPNGVSETEQQAGELRRRLNLAHEELLLVAAGRLESQKRFDKLLTFIRELKVTRKVTLAIFGKGPLEEELKQQAREQGLHECVHFMGFSPEFAALVGDADLFLLTSDEEGTPNAVLEAMAAGVPVLGYEVGAMRSLLDGELSDSLVQQGNDKLFLEKLKHLTAHPNELRARRDSYKRRALSELGFETSMLRYEQVLTEAARRA